MPIHVIVIYVAFLLLMATGITWARYHEKKEWNNGHCSRCQSLWVCFDVDSQGGRGYKCLCGRHIWISYKVDRYPPGVYA